MLAIQFLDYNFNQGFRKSLCIIGYFTIGIALILGLRELFINFALFNHWVWRDYVYSFVSPIAFATLLGFSFIVKKISLRNISVLIICLVLIIFPPSTRNLTSIIVEKPNEDRIAQMYYPFTTFSEQINFSENMKMYISPTLPAHYQMLMRRIEKFPACSTSILK